MRQKKGSGGGELLECTTKGSDIVETARIGRSCVQQGLGKAIVCLIGKIKLRVNY